MDCIFCKIVAGDIPAKKVYEDDQVLAFLDINPLTRGHAMVVPKEHGETILDLTGNTLKALMPAVKTVTQALDSTVSPDGFTTGLNQKVGQDVPHVHIHIIPRWNGDGGGNIHSIVRTEVNEDLDALAEKIKENIE